jgi:hypothetical protein
MESKKRNICLNSLAILPKWNFYPELLSTISDLLNFMSAVMVSAILSIIKISSNKTIIGYTPLKWMSIANMWMIVLKKYCFCSYNWDKECHLFKVKYKMQ